MKVTYEKTTEYKVYQYVMASDSDVFLRREFSVLDTERQITRAIKALIGKGVLVKIGYGVYVRLSYSELLGSTYLPKGFLALGREALTKLGVKWDTSEAEKAYNEGRSQQVPVNPPTRLLERFRRSLSYKEMELRFE